MDLVTLVYLADVLPNVAGIFAVLGGFAAAVGGFLFVVGFSDDSTIGMRLGKFLVPIGIVLGIFSSLIPSKTTMYMMAGASIAQEIHRDERTKKVYEKLYQVIDEQLDKALKK